MSNVKQAVIFIIVLLIVGFLCISASRQGYADGYASGLGKGLEEHCGIHE